MGKKFKEVFWPFNRLESTPVSQTPVTDNPYLISFSSLDRPDQVWHLFHKPWLDDAVRRFSSCRDTIDTAKIMAK